MSKTAIVHYEYDSFGRLTRVVRADGETTTFRWDLRPQPSLRDRAAAMLRRLARWLDRRASA